MSFLFSCIGCGTKRLPDKEEEKILDFQHCSLTALPFEVFDSERVLEELYLDFNQITELPRDLFHCHGLRVLSLSDNDLQDVPPAVSSLTHLTTLDFSKNGIADIPDNIKSCKKLRIVNASTNPLCRLPEGFTQLVALKELSLNDTFLEYLPANFGRLTGLEVLELRENQLNTLPRSMTRLTSLKRIDLGQNEFSELPEVVGHLSGLTDLWFDNNRIRSIPPDIGSLVNLTFLDASKNRIDDVSSKLGNCKKLVDLYLNNNDIECIPDGLCECVNLVNIHLDDNRIAFLPEKLGKLERLFELKICHNELVFLPPSCGLLRSIRVLHLDNNFLTTIPCDIGSCSQLVILTASHNQINKIPPEIGNLTRLKVLNLCGNEIQSLPVSFTKLEVKAFWLSENQTKPIFPLQSTVDPDTGHKVLTCYMLPQVPSEEPLLSNYDEDEPLLDSVIEARMARSSIHFASDKEPEEPGHLSRIPTPYPKELKALARHTRNLQVLRKSSTGEEPQLELKAREPPYTQEVSNGTKSAMVMPTPPIKKVKMAETLIVASENVVQADAITSYPKTDHKVDDVDIGPPESAPQQTTETDLNNRNKFFMSMETSTYSPTYVTESSRMSITSSTTANSTSKIVSSAFISLPDTASNRPASIAVPELTTRNHFNLTTSNSQSRWQNKRPGSLAAPINTVGVPAAESTLRDSPVAASTLRDSPVTANTLKDSPVAAGTLRDLPVAASTFRQSPFTDNTVRESSPLHSKGCLAMKENSPNEIPAKAAFAAPSQAYSTATAVAVSKSNDSPDSRNQTTPDSELVSIINQLTVDESSDVHGIASIKSRPFDIDVNPPSVYSNPEKEEEGTLVNENDDEDDEQLTFSTGQLTTPCVKTGQLTSPSQIKTNHYTAATSPEGMQIYSTSVTKTSSFIPMKVAVISPSQAKSTATVATTSQIKSPTSATSRAKSPSSIATPGTKSIGPHFASKLKEPSKTQSETPPKTESSSKIPQFGQNTKSPSVPISREDSNVSSTSVVSSSSMDKQRSQIPSLIGGGGVSHARASGGISKGRSLMSPERGTEERTSSKMGSRMPPIGLGSALERDNVSPEKGLSVSEVSPVQKPINTTGIPIISPGSRIPTTSNSSLRGKKSGLPVSTSRIPNYQVSPTGNKETTTRSNAWLETSP